MPESIGHAVLSLEYIGENTDALMRTGNAMAKSLGVDLGVKSNTPWVARISGRDPRFKLKREFVKGQKDYSQANSVGSRGVYLHFVLPDGVYEVEERVSWKNTRRYFLRVEQARYQEISRKEVEEWLEEQDKTKAIETP